MAEEVTELTAEERAQLERLLGKIPGGELLTGGSSHSVGGNSNGVGIVSIPPQVAWQTKQITPEPLTYFTKEDEILIVTFNSQVGQRPHIRGRFLRTDGVVVPFEYAWSPPADRSQHLFRFTLGEGFLLSFVVLPEFDTKRGQLWIRVAHRRFAEGIFLSITTLAQGYVSTAYPLNWPWWNMEHSVSGRGVTRSFVGTRPATGNFVVEYVPTNACWRLITITTALFTDGTATDRYPLVRVDAEPGTLSFMMTSTFGIGPWSESRIMCSTAVKEPLKTPVDMTHLPLPDGLYLNEGSRILIGAVNFQPGDILIAPEITVEEWIAP